jgi:hypothetical protein
MLPSASLSLLTLKLEILIDVTDPSANLDVVIF